MSYIRTTWVARVGTALNRFLKSNETTSSVELTADPTGVTTSGTPFTVDNMNKIEQGIYDAHEAVDLTERYDLLVDSDAKLALLGSVDTTTYTNVFIAQGIWKAYEKIDLYSHGVKTIKGGGFESIIQVNYNLGSGEIAIDARNVEVFSDISIKSNSLYSISSDAVFIGKSIGITKSFFQSFTNIEISCGNVPSGYGIGFKGVFGISCVSTQNLATGAEDCQHISNMYCENGDFVDCMYLSNCIAEDGDIDGCSHVSNCKATYIKDCLYVSNCTPTYITDCSYVSTTKSNNWSGNTYVDYRSTDCDQEWAYSSVNAPTTGYVLPRGVYNIVKTLSGTAFVDFYDGTSWVSSGEEITDTFCYGTVESDGANVRLRGFTATVTVYYRKAP